MGKTYNMKRFKIFLIFFFVLAAAAMTYFWPLIFRKPHIDETGIIKENLNNRAAAAKGVVESEEKADISSKVTGLILRIPVLENEHVRRGQSVVILDDKEVKAQIDEAEASAIKADVNYKKAKIDSERFERLYNNESVTLHELEESQRQMKSSEALLLEANARLKYLKTVLANYVLTSPIDGIVTRKHFEEGEVTQEGIPVLSIANTEKLRIKAEVDETDVGKIFVGQDVRILSDAYPGRIYRGYVKKILEKLDRKKIRSFDPVSWMDINTQEIFINLNDFEGLKIGMTVDVMFYPAGETR